MITRWLRSDGHGGQREAAWLSVEIFVNNGKISCCNFQHARRDCLRTSRCRRSILSGPNFDRYYNVLKSRFPRRDTHSSTQTGPCHPNLHIRPFITDTKLRSTIVKSPISWNDRNNEINTPSTIRLLSNKISQFTHPKLQRTATSSTYVSHHDDTVLQSHAETPGYNSYKFAKFIQPTAIGGNNDGALKDQVFDGAGKYNKAKSQESLWEATEADVTNNFGSIVDDDNPFTALGTDNPAEIAGTSTPFDTNWTLDNAPGPASRIHQTETDRYLLNIDYKAELVPALRRNDSDLVARCLLAANTSNDLEFVRTITDEAFSNILQCLQPSNFVEKLATAHLELSFGMVKKLGIAPINQIAYEYSHLLTQITGIRRLAGVKLRLEDYKILLRSARDLGNAKLAYVTWRALDRDECVPDTECYNYYMAAYVWNGVHRPSARHRVRVVPFNVMGRKAQHRQTKFANYRVETNDGVMATAKVVFEAMLKSGAVGDEESFRILILAAAREGMMDTVKTILRKVWGIDVDALTSGGSCDHVPPKTFADDSPLRPSSKLLFALAHAFGINNDISTALRVVDYVARQYRISITTEVWSQLFEWTFVMSINRTGTSRHDGSSTGELRSGSLLDLWNTMTGEPYMVQPTMRMYNFLIKNLASRAQTPLVVEKISEGIALYKRHNREAKLALTDLRRVTDTLNQTSTDLSVEQTRQRWEYLDLIRRRDVYWLRRWLALLLQSFDEWHRNDWVDQHYARGLPALLWQWREWAPTTVGYETPTALVEFVIRTREEIAVKARSKAMHLREQQRRVDLYAPRYVGHEWVKDARKDAMIMQGRRHLRAS